MNQDTRPTWNLLWLVLCVLALAVGFLLGQETERRHEPPARPTPPPTFEVEHDDPDIDLARIRDNEAEVICWAREGALWCTPEWALEEPETEEQ